MTMIEVYVAAGHRRDAAQKELDALTERIRDGLEKLKRPRDIAIKSAEYSCPSEVELGADPLPELDLTRWPSGPDIATALRAWYRADDEMRKAWEAVPLKDRARLLPPESM